MAKYALEEELQSILRYPEIKESSHSYDNSVMEKFFCTMKSECLYLEEFDNVEHFKLELENYINYDNTKRIDAK